MPPEVSDALQEQIWDTRGELVGKDRETAAFRQLETSVTADPEMKAEVFDRLISPLRSIREQRLLLVLERIRRYREQMVSSAEFREAAEQAIAKHLPERRAHLSLRRTLSEEILAIPPGRNVAWIPAMRNLRNLLRQDVGDFVELLSKHLETGGLRGTAKFNAAEARELADLLRLFPKKLESARSVAQERALSSDLSSRLQRVLEENRREWLASPEETFFADLSKQFRELLLHGLATESPWSSPDLATKFLLFLEDPAKNWTARTDVQMVVEFLRMVTDNDGPVPTERHVATLARTIQELLERGFPAEGTQKELQRELASMSKVWRKENDFLVERGAELKKEIAQSQRTFERSLEKLRIVLCRIPKAHAAQKKAFERLLFATQERKKESAVVSRLSKELYRIEQVQWLLKDLFSLLSSPDRVDQGGALAVVSMMVFFGAREGDLLAKTPGEDPPLAKKILRRKESGRPAVQY